MSLFSQVDPAWREALKDCVRDFDEAWEYVDAQPSEHRDPFSVEIMQRLQVLNSRTGEVIVPEGEHQQENSSCSVSLELSHGRENGNSGEMGLQFVCVAEQDSDNYHSVTNTMQETCADILLLANNFMPYDKFPEKVLLDVHSPVKRRYVEWGEYPPVQSTSASSMKLFICTNHAILIRTSCCSRYCPGDSLYDNRVDIYVDVFQRTYGSVAEILLLACGNALHQDGMKQAQNKLSDLFTSGTAWSLDSVSDVMASPSVSSLTWMQPDASYKSTVFMMGAHSKVDPRHPLRTMDKNLARHIAEMACSSMSTASLVDALLRWVQHGTPFFKQLQMPSRRKSSSCSSSGRACSICMRCGGQTPNII